MHRLQMAILILAVGMPASAQDQRRIDMNFNGQMASAVAELKNKMNADPDLKGRKLRLGKFGGPNLPDSNFELAFESTLEKLLEETLDDESDFIVSGEYDFLSGRLPENMGLKVIQVEIKIVDPSRRVLQRILREINNTEDIAEIHGATVAPPDTTDFEKRNKAVTDATNRATRSFSTRNDTQVTAAGNDNYAVEILKRNGGTGPLVAVKPRDVKGLAFADLNVGDTFEIVLYTYATNCDASCVVTIDGLDVANTFSTDSRKYDGYVIPRAKRSSSSKHPIPGWLQTTKRSTKNVYSFVVNELGKGAATAMKSRNRKGIINVKFFEAVPPEQSLPSRTFGEVGKGEPIDIGYKTTRMKRRETPVSNISIRYSTR